MERLLPDLLAAEDAFQLQAQLPTWSTSSLTNSLHLPSTSERLSVCNCTVQPAHGGLQHTAAAHG